MCSYKISPGETGLDDSNKKRGVPQLQRQLRHAGTAQWFSSRERADPLWNLSVEVRFVRKDVPVSQPWRPYQVEQAAPHNQRERPQARIHFLDHFLNSRGLGKLCEFLEKRATLLWWLSLPQFGRCSKNEICNPQNWRGWSAHSRG